MLSIHCQIESKGRRKVNEKDTVPTPFLAAISVVLKAGFLLGFLLKNKIKAHPSYENKQGARSITDRQEMVWVRYL